MEARQVAAATAQTKSRTFLTRGAAHGLLPPLSSAVYPGFEFRFSFSPSLRPAA
jgi:hypothetical protein